MPGEGVTVGATKAEFTVTETVLEAGEVTGVVAESVTLQIIERARILLSGLLFLVNDKS